MNEWKKPERGDASARKRREPGGKTESEKEAAQIRRANIAGEEYVSPREASPAYAPADEIMEATRLMEKGEPTGSDEEIRMRRRANIAGESYEMPAKKKELREPGKNR